MRDLFIVSRREVELYEYLRRRFEGRDDVEVVLDRRDPARPGHPEHAGAERRRRVFPVDDDIETLGFAVVPIRTRRPAP